MRRGDSRENRRSERAASVRGAAVFARLLFAMTFAALAATACASSSPASGASARPNPNLITADEIAKVNVQTAYEIVQKLRPTMLRPRQMATANAQASGELLVYMDNNRLGGVDQLRQVSASSVASVRYYSASEAQLKWGSGHPGGVIEVITRR